MTVSRNDPTAGSAEVKGLVVSDWKRLCGLAVALCGSQAAFRKEARILQRLVKRYRVEETERMLKGAKLLRWDSLRSLGSQEGLGRRMAVQAYWAQVNRRQRKGLESLGEILNEAQRRAKGAA